MLVIAVVLVGGCRETVTDKMPSPPFALVRFIPPDGATVPLGAELGLEAAGGTMLPADPPPDQIKSRISLVREIREPGPLEAEVTITMTATSLSARIIPMAQVGEGQYSIRFERTLNYEPDAQSSVFRSPEGWIGSRFTVSPLADAATD